VKRLPEFSRSATLCNTALRLIHSTHVSITSQEVTGGMFLDSIILEEAPGVNPLVGCLVTLPAIILRILPGEGSAYGIFSPKNENGPKRVDKEKRRG
jgi:hypothetical protein